MLTFVGRVIGMHTIPNCLLNFFQEIIQNADDAGAKTPFKPAYGLLGEA